MKKQLQIILSTIFMVWAGPTPYGQDVGYIFTDGGTLYFGKATIKGVNDINQ